MFYVIFFRGKKGRKKTLINKHFFSSLSRGSRTGESSRALSFARRPPSLVLNRDKEILTQEVISERSFIFHGDAATDKNPPGKRHNLTERSAHSI